MAPWTDVRDAEVVRRVVRSGPARRVLTSGTGRRLVLERHRRLARRATRHEPGRFAGVRTLCVTIGHTKSGASLLGGLLDADPRVVMSDERDALGYVEAGFERDALFHMIDRGARREARKGRVSARRLGEPYAFAVPGQSQGHSRAPVVVGDTTTGATTRRLARDPALLPAVRELLEDVQLRLVQVVRNPFEPISVMMSRGGRTLAEAVDHYFTACEQLADIRSRVEPDLLLELRYEDVVADPRAALARVCRFVGIEPDPGHLDACAAVVAPRAAHRHTLVDWTAAGIRDVEARIATVDFLEGYTHDT
jgi:hypothetical protein